MEPNQNQDSAQSPAPQGASQDFSQPVAYDQQGRPLYAHPPQHPNQSPAGAGQPSQPPAPQYVYMSRPLEPAPQPISDEIMQRSEDSKKRYPQLNLSKGEYVILAVRRHPIGLFKIWGGILAVILVLLAVLWLFSINSSGLADSLSLSTDGNTALLGSILIGFLILLMVGGGLIATYVYNSNRFYLTNESVIQEIRTSLFGKNEQTVSLANIEDASYHQTGLLPNMLNYGLIRLSTEGDETTYRFNYAANPKQQVAVLNDAIEAFKNGRPVHF